MCDSMMGLTRYNQWRIQGVGHGAMALSRTVFNVRVLMSFQRYFWIRLLIQAIKQSHSTIDAALYCRCADTGNLLTIPPVKEL